MGGDRPARIARAVAVPVLAWGLAACVETGDFGRPKASAWNRALAATGSAAAAARGEPVSASLLTDDETELRARAWRYLMPAHDRRWFDRTLAELAATRILPPLLFPDPEAYHRALRTDAAISPASRFRRLSEDASADARLMEPFAIVAVRVLTADRARLKALAFVDTLTDGQAADAFARVAENRCLIAWVRRETDVRALAYRHALQHLFLESPQKDSIGAERALAAFDARHQAFERQLLGVGPIEACEGGPPDLLASEPVPRVPAAPARPLVRKG